MPTTKAIVPFLFSDLTQAKRRPALVPAELEGEDRVFCQITSQHVRDQYAIALDDADFKSGGLKQKSHVRSMRHSDSVVFTDHKSLNTGHCLVQNDFLHQAPFCTRRIDGLGVIPPGGLEHSRLILKDECK